MQRCAARDARPVPALIRAGDACAGPRQLLAALQGSPPPSPLPFPSAALSPPPTHPPSQFRYPLNPHHPLTPPPPPPALHVLNTFHAPTHLLSLTPAGGSSPQLRSNHDIWFWTPHGRRRAILALPPSLHPYPPSRHPHLARLQVVLDALSIRNTRTDTVAAAERETAQKCTTTPPNPSPPHPLPRAPERPGTDPPGRR